MNRLAVRGYALAATLLAGGCGGDNVVEIWPPPPILEVEVIDSVTRAPYVGPVTLRAVDGAYVEEKTVSVRGTGTFLGGQRVRLADERPAVYTVEVIAPGYRPWRMDGVDVRNRHREIYARLQRP